MGCVTGIVRLLMFIFNFACLAVGIVLIAVGTLFYLSIDQYDKILEEASGLNIVPSITIAVGVIVFIISFLGCCGALKHSSCMLYMYAIILIVLLIAQFSISIYGIVKADKDDSSLRDTVLLNMRKALLKYESNDVVRDVFQSIQSSLECCGVDSKEDYKTILHLSYYPGGCCGLPLEEQCPVDKTPHDQGCGVKFFETLADAIQIVAIVALVICAVEFLGATFAICLARNK